MSQFSNVTRISIAGRPTFEVPAGSLLNVFWKQCLST